MFWFKKKPKTEEELWFEFMVKHGIIRVDRGCNKIFDLGRMLEFPEGRAKILKLVESVRNKV